MPCPLRVVCLIAVGIVLIEPAPKAQVKFINGVFVALQGSAPRELIAYAEANSRGLFRMQSGSLEDAPTVHEIVSVLCSLPLWRPAGVIVTTAEIFRDERAEQRHLVFAQRKFNVYATGLRVADLESRAKIDSLLRSVRATLDNPGYAFVVIVTEGHYRRYYPIRLTPQER